MKTFASILIIITALFVFDVIVKKEDAPISQEDKSSQIMSVLDIVDDEFGLFGYSVSHEESIIYIVMDALKSEKELKEYLSKQITQEDLKQYSFDIIKRPLEEVEAESNLVKIESILNEYFEEEYFTDIQRVISFIEPEPTIKIDLAKDSIRSAEEFETELKSLLASDKFDFISEGFKYKFQIEKTDDI
ncbi:hypothetical protein [Bacillus sp. 7894-2]|uniref:hypothetical protein n=1 Tax=Bacillus sp. 7894-2 TaxID=2021695 RepID=UPI000BA69E12|nr:hypothetical protein [Bacillus sp. 7894-2]PAE24983.1 hypothetical protein CHI10_10080 [Bacillus sp. 7894-2]